MRTPYLETIDGLVDWDRMRAAKFRFLVDPMHGAGRGTAARAFAAARRWSADEIRGTRDPLFGGVNPEPIEPHVEALRKRAVRRRLRCRVCADGDGDRIGAMDRDGTFITPHQIFSILLWHLAGTRKMPGDVAKTFSTTKMIDKIAAKFGRKVCETPIGFKYICEQMLERDICWAAKRAAASGRSSICPSATRRVTALLLAEVMAWHGKSLGELVAMLQPEFGEHHYGRVDLTLRDGQKEKAIAHFSDAKFRAARLAHRSPRGSGRHQGVSRRNRLGDGARVGN